LTDSTDYELHEVATLPHGQHFLTPVNRMAYRSVS